MTMKTPTIKTNCEWLWLYDEDGPRPSREQIAATLSYALGTFGIVAGFDGRPGSPELALQFITEPAEGVVYDPDADEGERVKKKPIPKTIGWRLTFQVKHLQKIKTLMRHDPRFRVQPPQEKY